MRTRAAVAWEIGSGEVLLSLPEPPDFQGYARE